MTIIHGAMNPFRVRDEHWNIKSVEDVTKFERIRSRKLNPAERDLITRELLEQVTTFPHLREEQAQVLKTIAALGPEKALRQPDYYYGGKCRANSRNNPNPRVMLDVASIAKAMGVNKIRINNLLKYTRQILREFFNYDGSLFAIK